MSQGASQGYRLSPQQARLWSLQEAADGASPERAECWVRIEGPLRPDVLAGVLDELVARHEILRTIFYRPPGLLQPLQVILPQGQVRFHLCDLTALAPRRRDEACEALDAVAKKTAGASGENVDAVLATLVKLSPRAHLLQLALPGLCTDTAGLPPLVGEMTTAYARRRAGELPESSAIQYVDVAAALNDLLESADTKSGVRQWSWLDFARLHEQRLGDETPADPAKGFSPRSVAATIAGGLAAANQLAASAGVPLQAVLLTAWQALLWRLTAGRGVTVGVHFGGRSHPELRRALGPLARHLPIHLAACAALPFTAAAREVSSALGHAAQWQDFFTWPQPGTFFPHCFELAARPAPLVAAGLTFTCERLRARPERFIARLVLTPAGGDLEAELQYDGWRLGEPQARRLLARFQILLEDLARRDAGASLDTLEILSPAERQQVRALARSSLRERDGWRLHEAFAAQAARTPDAVAIELEAAHVTYGELDGRANQLAHRLRSLGAAAEVPVAVCVERSPEMVAGLLAILKAGAAWVPLDPGYPTARLAFMLESCGVRIVLTGADLPPVTPAGAHPLCLAPWPCAGESAGCRCAGADRAELAYIIYTSGSTGRPKGVMVPHQAICNRLLWMQERFPLGPGDRVLQKTTLGFDASIWEIFLPLLAGSKLVLARPGGHRDTGYLAATVAERGVTVLQVVPSLLRELLEEPRLQDCHSLRRVFSGGEELPAALVQRFRQRLTTELCNLYGPTETAIDATFHLCQPAEGGPSVPIGRPLTNVEVHLLDPAQQLVPPGAVGEIYVGGLGLARGYVGRPDLTAERFLPDPLAAEPGQRLYRTGDLGSYDESGRLHYLGRGDRQVKLRGHRIELAEIEEVLRRQPGVQEAVVASWADGAGEARLVAYVLWAGASSGALPALRLAAASELPELMVPAFFVELEQLPLLPNGKVDRAALPPPAPATAAPRGAASATPRTPLEEMIAGIWCEVLGLPQVDTGADFFALGGHSLLATRIMLRVRDACRIDIAVRDLFDAPTVGALARRVEELVRAQHWAAQPPPLKRGPRPRPLPLSFAQQRLWFLDRLEPGNPAYNIPAALRLAGDLDVAALRAALAAVVRRHEALRTTFVLEAGEPAQSIGGGPTLALPVVDLAALAANAGQALVKRLARAEGQRTFDLERGPLARFTLLRCGEREHVVLVTLHHIVADGWSIGILVDEVAHLYEACRTDEPAPLAPLPVQYADYALWQRGWLRGAALDAELAWWRERLGGMPSALDLPTDRPRPRERSLRGADRLFSVPTQVAAALRKLARSQGATLFMVLLAAWKTVLSRHTGQREIVVGTPVANRTRVEIERLIGFFLNTLVLRTDLGGAPDFGQALGRVREVALGAYAHQDLPFEKLVELLQPERDLSRTPLFQALFNLQTAGPGWLALGDLRITPLELGSETEKFDLTLMMLDDGERLSGSLRYSVDLFDGATMARLARRLTHLLREIAAEPERHLADLSFLDEPERHQLLVEWAGRGVTGVQAALHTLFERQAAAHPDTVAVVAAGRRWTYGEVNRRANQLAHFLLRHGLAPEEPVAICLARGPAMVVSTLAALKAGGAFMPLDPRTPPSRLEPVLARSRPSWILTQEGLLADLLPQTGSLLRLGGDLPALAVEPPADPALPVAATRLAYIMHTSGSTGIPKGVAIAHGGVTRYMEYLAGRWGLGPADTVLNLAALTFDPAVRDLFGPLSTGGRLVLVDDLAARDPAALLAAIRGERVTCLLSVVPSLLDAMVAAAGKDTCASVRLLMTCGEALSAEHCARARAVFAHAMIVNQYGPTEGTMSQLYHPVPAAAAHHGVPVGRSIPGARCFVLDAAGRPAPIGVHGEICVAGPGLARGYLDDPELTACRFTPLPFSRRPGERLYRTGDRGRWLADGAVEFLGRLDQQIKLRGFRIELGDIEAALARHPAVSQAAVRIWETGGDSRLVGYAAHDGQPAPAGEDLRAYLRGALPEYMVPAKVLVLAALPLTRSGKVDRLALPPPSWLRPDLDHAYVAARDAVEEVVAAVWAEVLGIDRVGVRDSFFDLGGHSLAGMQVIHRLRDTFQVEVSVRSIFMEPTVERLARALTAEEPRPGYLQKIADAFLRVRAMSPEAVRAMLDHRQQRKGASHVS